MKRPFLITVDYGSGGTAFIVQAHSREQIDTIFGLPAVTYIEVLEDDFERSPLYRFHMDRSGEMLTYDVDAPEGTLLHYMEKNRVPIPARSMPRD